MEPDEEAILDFVKDMNAQGQQAQEALLRPALEVVAEIEALDMQLLERFGYAKRSATDPSGRSESGSEQPAAADPD